jgi:hypothetical protein
MPLLPSAVFDRRGGRGKQIMSLENFLLISNKQAWFNQLLPWQ